MNLTNKEQNIEIFQFSENANIAQLQADTIRHAINVKAQLSAEIHPEFQETKRVKIRTEADLQNTKAILNTVGIFVIAVCFIFFVSHVSTKQIDVPVPRTIEYGELENKNKLLQWELVLAKRELELKELEKKIVNK